MSRVVESRQGRGPGIFILQDHEARTDLVMRSFMSAVRKVGRTDEGAYIVGDGTEGDLIGAFLWESDGKGGGTHSSTRTIDGSAGAQERPIPAWSWIYPVQTVGGNVSSTAEDGEVRGGDQVKAWIPKAKSDGAGGETKGEGKPKPNAAVKWRKSFARVESGLQQVPFTKGYASGGIRTGGFEYDDRNTSIDNLIGIDGGFGTYWNKWRPNSGTGSTAAAWYAAQGQENERRVATTVRPTRDDLHDPDQRLVSKLMRPPDLWPDFPVRWHGLSVMGTNEKAQVEYFHPTDPRLVAVNESDATSCSTLVCDLDSDSDEPDEDRHARLSSALMVVLGPSNSPNRNNALAWPLGPTRKRDVRGGYVCDFETTRAVTPRKRQPFDRGDIPPSGISATEKRLGLGVGEDKRKAAIESGGVYDETLIADVLDHLSVGAEVNLNDPALSGVEDRATGIRPFRPRDRGSKTPLVFACMSIHDGGPIDVGGRGDKHQIGLDGDGRLINAAHISTEALFRDRNDPSRDGPMIYNSEYRPGTNFAMPVEVHLSYDFERKGFAWWGSSAFYSPAFDEPPYELPPPPPPPTTPPDDPRDRPRRNGIVVPGSGGSDPDVERDRRRRAAQRLTAAASGTGNPPTNVGALGPNEIRDILATHMETAFPAIVGRPNMISDRSRDLRHWRTPSVARLKKHDRETPITGRIVAFGAQGGAQGGPHLPEPGRWDYTQEPRESRHAGGTAAGGFLVTPPEISLEDVDADLEPDNRTISTTFFSLAPNARLAFGVPELAQGLIRDGWVVFRKTSTGSLLFGDTSSTGAVTENVEFHADGGVSMHNLASGSTQGNAGAAAGELWHDTTDDTIKMGV